MNDLDSDKAALWRAGRLKYKLHADQRWVYDKYQAWRKQVHDARLNNQPLPGKNPLVWCTDCSRRWGKDYLGLIIAFEDAIKRPNANLTYATSTLKELGNIVVPLANQLIQDAPANMRPVYRTNFRGTSEGLYFGNGSVLKFVGIDMNRDALRGQHSDGVFVSEAAFCSELEYVLNVVLQPQLIGRNHATVMCNSTPPEALHFWDQELVPDAKNRDAYVLRTIDDAPQYTNAEKELFTGGEEGRKTGRVRREYYCERIREATSVVLPEFDAKKHVREFEIPKFAHGYTVIDPGVSDLCAVNYIAWDFENARMLVFDEYTKRNANTTEIVEDIRQKEAQYWANHEGYWDGANLKQNPYGRYSDVDLRMITDMQQLHGVAVSPVRKDDAEAALAALRNAFLANKIWIHPRCKNTIEHCLGAVWNKARSSYLRSERLGHADHVDSLKYALRSMDRSRNPFPPTGWLAVREKGKGGMLYKESHFRHPNNVMEKLASLLPSTWSRKT